MDQARAAQLESAELKRQLELALSDNEALRSRLQEAESALSQTTQDQEVQYSERANAPNRNPDLGATKMRNGPPYYSTCSRRVCPGCRLSHTVQLYGILYRT